MAKKPKYAVSFEINAGDDDGVLYPVKFVKEDIKASFGGVTKLKVVKVAG